MLNPVLAEQHRAISAVKARINATRVIALKPKPRPFRPSWVIERKEDAPKRTDRVTRFVADADHHVRAFRRHQQRAPLALGPAYVAAASRFFDIDAASLLSHGKQAHIARPRQILMYVMRSRLSNSLPKIGRTLGGRDHTTILWGVRKIAAERATDPSIDQAIAAIEADVLANQGRLS